MKININSSISYDIINNEVNYNKKPNNLHKIDTTVTEKAVKNSENKLDLTKIDYESESKNFDKNTIKNYFGDFKNSQTHLNTNVLTKYI